MALDFFEMKQTGASVGASKIETFEEAQNRLVLRLKQQLNYWKDDKGANATNKDGKPLSARSFWFKKMSLSDNYMFQLKIGQQPVYLTEEAAESKEPWVHNIPENQMSGMIQSIIDRISDKDEAVLEKLKPAYEVFRKANEKK